MKYFSNANTLVNFNSFFSVYHIYRFWVTAFFFLKSMCTLGFQIIFKVLFYQIFTLKLTQCCGPLNTLSSSINFKIISDLFLHYKVFLIIWNEEDLKSLISTFWRTSTVPFWISFVLSAVMVFWYTLYHSRVYFCCWMVVWLWLYPVHASVWSRTYCYRAHSRDNEPYIWNWLAHGLDFSRKIQLNRSRFTLT